MNYIPCIFQDTLRSEALTTQYVNIPEAESENLKAQQVMHYEHTNLIEEHISQQEWDTSLNAESDDSIKVPDFIVSNTSKSSNVS